jgi:ferredoxin
MGTLASIPSSVFLKKRGTAAVFFRSAARGFIFLTGFWNYVLLEGHFGVDYHLYFEYRSFQAGKRKGKMRTNISKSKIRDDFVRKVEEISGQKLLACYQCGKCSAGCPAVGEMDILPNQVIRYAQLGFKEELLAAKSIWVCASCYTCNVRCPKGIKIAEVMEAVRQILLRKRKDHVRVSELSAAEKAGVPAIALISNFRKFTS